MTADPSRFPDQPAAWFVVTDQGVRLAGPYGDPQEALEARTGVVERLQQSMEQERFTGAQIAAQTRSVVAGWGHLVGPHQHFCAVQPPG